jgi:hypothetical protein
MLVPSLPECGLCSRWPWLPLAGLVRIRLIAKQGPDMFNKKKEVSAGEDSLRQPLTSFRIKSNAIVRSAFLPKQFKTWIFDSNS